MKETMTLSVCNKPTVTLTLTREGSMYVISEPTRDVVTQGQTVVEALDRMVTLIKVEDDPSAVEWKPFNE